MNSLTYNREEQDFIERIHAVFPKVELDPEVAIGALQSDNETFILGSCEPLVMEFFFREKYDWERLFSEFMPAWKKDLTIFYPAQFKPLPWWEVKFGDIRERRGMMDGMVWMSSYGKHYYFPFFILASLHDLSLNRQKLATDFNECFVHGDFLRCLTPDLELKGKDCWEEANKIDPGYKDPRFKNNLYGLIGPTAFLIFISFFNEEQKRLISEFAHYYIHMQLTQNFKDWDCVDDQEMMSRLKSCWHFAG